jgi:2-C-methyl-D-erythritol 4-phosphate cytidylyltransferase / 2-C-methyl-D-erythritol 2,4-cyclodiphosphate synthase
MQGKVVAVVPAAGLGRRMGSRQPKQFLPLSGRPLLVRTLELLEAAEAVDQVVLVCPPGGEEQAWEQYVRPYGLGKVARVVPGGKERQDSVAAGVSVAAQLGAAWVLVHDAARPLSDPELFGRVLAGAQESGAAIAALPVSDTVKRCGGDGVVQATLDREHLWLVQTPQAFRLDLLQEALALAAQDGFYATDEAGLIERMGGQVKLVKGSRDNLKITTPGDLVLAEAILGQTTPAARTGQGLDIHRLVKGRPLILGGVDIPFELGLDGHSDADVLTHAVMDALLAAAGLGDIGGLFPDSDPAYRGADSLDLMRQVVIRLAQAGWRPAQVSVTLAAEAPKIAPHAQAMRANLAQAMGLEPEAVNVAATTSEGLGFIGRGQGMAALATAVIAPKGG